jgi:hypothetical protein
MPFAALGAVASVATIASAAYGMANSGGGGGGDAYVPQNQQGGDANAQQNMYGLTHNAQLGNTIARNIISNPYQRGVIPGAERAGHYLTSNLGPRLQRDSARIGNEANRGFGAANRELNTAFDPQNALYNRTLQQTQDQTLAGLSATGVGNSPYAAGVLGQTLGNFNIDWRNNQLAREQSGLQSYGQYLGQGGNAYTASGNLGNAAAGAYTTGSALPYSTYVGMQNAGLGALTQGSNLNSSASSAAQGYLGIGQTGQQIGFNQGQQIGQNLGQGLSGLSQAYNQYQGGSLPAVSGGTYGSTLSYQPIQSYQDPGSYGSFG